MKFSIRDLLLVTVIVALATGWWVDRSQLATEIVRLKEARESAITHAWFDAINRKAARSGTRPRIRIPLRLSFSSTPAVNPPKE